MLRKLLIFVNYYALDAKKLFEKQNLGNYPGEQNTYFFEPRGISLVISPWNFPFAIPCGMIAASLVTGNCVAFKPAEQTSLIGSKLYEAFKEAGLPEKSISFLPGIGEEVGSYLSNDNRISTIAFTGSRRVGLEIIENANNSNRKGKHIPKVIAEMGGKNAIIVDNDADIDQAIKGVIHSAFSYQGQKCSACSRVVVLEEAYDNFIKRIAEATKSITVAPPSSPNSFVGPVIDEDAYNRISAIIERSKKECKVIAEAPVSEELLSKNYIAPIIFSNIPEDHELLRTEIFGPVLAVIKADSFDSAIKIALDSEYGLTGGVFSRSPKNIEKAIKEFNVGNLYINRSCTGALVMRQPFGGAMMSGVGSKAGGPDYLKQFVIPRSISENTMRRGFAPEN